MKLSQLSLYYKRHGQYALYSSYYFKNYQAYLLILNGFIELVNCMY